MLIFRGFEHSGAFSFRVLRGKRWREVATSNRRRGVLRVRFATPVSLREIDALTRKLKQIEK